MHIHGFVHHTRHDLGDGVRKRPRIVFRLAQNETSVQCCIYRIRIEIHLDVRLSKLQALVQLMLEGHASRVPLANLVLVPGALAFETLVHAQAIGPDSRRLFHQAASCNKVCHMQCDVAIPVHMLGYGTANVDFVHSCPGPTRPNSHWSKNVSNQTPSEERRKAKRSCRQASLTRGFSQEANRSPF